MLKAIVVVIATTVFSILIVLFGLGVILKATTGSRAACVKMLNSMFQFNTDITPHILGSFTVSFDKNLRGTGFEFASGSEEITKRISGRQLFTATPSSFEKIEEMRCSAVEESEGGSFRESHIEVIYSIGKSNYQKDKGQLALFATIKSDRTAHACGVRISIQNFSGENENEKLLMSLRCFTAYIVDLK